MNVLQHDIEQLIFERPEESFSIAALRVFAYQYKNNEVYNQFCNALNVEPSEIRDISQIPFLPVSLFKTRKIITTSFKPEIIFKSSGTTGTVSSKHYVKNIRIYKESFLRGFSKFYGPVHDWCIIGLLPSYLEREDSSLVYMVNELVKQSEDPESGFYLYELEKLKETLQNNEKERKRTFLIGVTYALLDFAERFPMRLKYTTLVETGGMKGRRDELTREEVHSILAKQLGVNAIHSEYGLTELLSQAWSYEKGLFQSPPWMKVLIRSEDDPFNIIGNSGDVVRGAINIIDLANYYSCSFIATDDIGTLFPDGSFTIDGRLDNSDIRGCGLMWI